MPEYTGSLIDHLNLAVPDLDRSVAFYTPVLATLGVVTLLEVPADPSADQLRMHGFGRFPKPFFWLREQGSAGTGTHLAFTAPDRAAVDAFYAAALAAGAASEVAPAVHPEYQPDYYGAFVTDLDGVSLEAVCHRPPA